MRSSARCSRDKRDVGLKSGDGVGDDDGGGIERIYCGR